MKKLKNTITNRLIVFGSLVIGGAVLGAAIAHKGDRKSIAIAGAIVGLIITTGVSSWVIEPKKEK